MSESTTILVVCLGNICRSPAGETILAALAAERGLNRLEIESCGTGDWNLGMPPDPRMQVAAHNRGWELSGVARGIREADFERFDYILAVDREILHSLQLKATSAEHHSKIYLISDFSREYRGKNIPDPYYGTPRDFELALEMLEDACRGFLEKLAD